MMPERSLTIITLLSDFGLNDPYVAQMKAVIRSVSANAEIVDISHGIEKHRIATGSFILETTVPFFPRGSVHVAVVDPSVGSSRLPIVVKCDNGLLLGPDNGLLSRASEKLGFQAAYQIENTHFIRNKISSTFHGRDIYASAAAAIAAGTDAALAGPKLARITRLEIPDPIFSNQRVVCRVLYVDSFGNIVTNISGSDRKRLEFREGQSVKIHTGKSDESFRGVTAKSYFEISEGRFGFLLGSQGYFEIALKESSAAARFDVEPMDRLEIDIS